MIKSMTGFATVEHAMSQGTLQIELRTVNQRYSEIIFKLDDNLRIFEPQIREQIQNTVKRGKVDCKVLFKQHDSLTQGNKINHHALEQVSALITSAQQHFEQAQPVDMLEVLKMPGILETESVASDTLLQGIEAALPKALTDLSAARASEGEKLKAVILERLEQAAALVAQVKPLMPNLIASYQAKLTEKLKQAIAEDDERVRQEVVIYAQKIDVDEELSRLDAHVAEVRNILAAGGVVGKRLDFLMQEMNREANTLGSKSVSIETTNVSMQLKVLIEQMREQIQNIE